MSYSQSVPALISKNVGNSLTNYKTWGGVVYNVKSYGAEGDGSTDDFSDLSTLINTTINGAQATLLFPSGTYKLSGSITIPSNITVWFVKGAMLSPDSGIIVTINGSIEAGIYQIFSGTGSILGAAKVDQVYPQWFGCDDTGTSDVVTGWNKALALLEAMSGGVLHCRNGNYLFNSKPNPLKGSVYLQGEGVNNTRLTKNYVETTATNGFMAFDVSNSGGVIEHLMLLNNLAGGAAISLISAASESPDFSRLNDLYVTGSAAWNYALYVDGTARNSLGLRDLKVNNCDFFAASTAIVAIKGFNNCTMDNIGIYGAGGTVNNFDIEGGSGFASNYLSARLVYCTEVNIAVAGTVNQVIIECPLITTVSNGVGANNVVVIGRVGAKQHNWSSGCYLDPSAGSTSFGGWINKGGGDFSSEKKSASGNSSAGYVGSHRATSVTNGLTYTFTTSSSKMFSIYLGGGQAALFHADYLTAAITILSNPSGVFENSSTPTAGKTGVFKSANSHVISIKNNMGSTQSINLGVYGSDVSTITDPA